MSFMVMMVRKWVWCKWSSCDAWMKWKWWKLWWWEYDNVWKWESMNWWRNRERISTINNFILKCENDESEMSHKMQNGIASSIKMKMVRLTYENDRYWWGPRWFEYIWISIIGPLVINFIEWETRVIVMVLVWFRRLVVMYNEKWECDDGNCVRGETWKWKMTMDNEGGMKWLWLSPRWKTIKISQ